MLLCSDEELLINKKTKKRNEDGSEYLNLRIYRGSFIFQIFLFFPVFNIVGLKSGKEGRGGGEIVLK